MKIARDQRDGNGQKRSRLLGSVLPPLDMRSILDPSELSSGIDGFNNGKSYLAAFFRDPFNLVL